MKNFLRSLIALTYLIAATPAPAEFLLNSYAVAPALQFAYVNTYFTNTNDDNPIFAAQCGANGTNKLVVVVITAPSNQAMTALDIDGQAGTLVITSGSAARLTEIWQVSGVTNTSCNIQPTFAGSQNATAIHVYVGYPASSTAVDAVGTNNSASSLTFTDVAKTNGGFTICGSKRNDTSDVAWTQNGAETIIENTPDSYILEAADSVSAASHINTATTTTNDYVATFTGSVGVGGACASWGP